MESFDNLAEESAALIRYEAPTSFGIKSWAEKDRPREKLLQKGRSALSDAELMGILLGSGTARLSAVDVARLILSAVENDLNELAKLSVKELMRHKGIGEAKAITIIAALELGRRRKETAAAARTTITCSRDIYQLIRPNLQDLPHEEFWVILLNRANVVMRKQPISSGGVAGTVADPKMIFKHALEQLASSIILVHNHPSGNLKPSAADIALTRKLKEAGQFLDLPILDHLIYTDHGYYSFADEGVL
ncbi:DNA replication and repair protein RadC [Hymenobacter roseosalivarius DSM 11622]|uniref:DNA replication and repair protein RadC n=1 Tax=Hymenobacter roseosalivarius DSM 11622 TaxID=645990 RepID=A0A1W1V4J2_9BACT|nr:DNA repair protein RadC [Hymenobacter roseosalivarius]SMB88160.1 DNA replication and repair protein RadC [Hymenobacter roseosalivarius DSM 11622]